MPLANKKSNKQKTNEKTAKNLHNDQLFGSFSHFLEQSTAQVYVGIKFENFQSIIY